MVEPIGIIGSLLAVIQVSQAVISVCRDYQSGFKGAPREITQIADELHSVANIAQRLLKLAQDDDALALRSLKDMARDGGALNSCLVELLDLEKKLKLDQKKGLKTALAWPLKRTEAVRRLQSIQGIKSTMQLALNADFAENIISLTPHVRVLPLIEANVLTLKDNLAHMKAGDETLELLKLIGGYDQSTSEDQGLRKCVDGTGDWLLQKLKYTEWKNNPDGILWVNGIAGCGKSVLCAKVIQDLQAHCHRRDYASLNYFYIDGADRRAFDIACLCRTFLAQLIASGNIRPSDLNHITPISAPSAKWEVELINALKKFTQSFIVIDGLDECEDKMEGGLQEVIKFMERIKDPLQGRAHLIAFSRDTETLRHGFQELHAMSIPVQGNSLSADLQTALKYQLGQHKFARWPGALKQEIEETLLGQANGSFRWLDCQIESLKRCATPAAVKRVLGDLPQSLEEHYRRVFQNIEPNNRISVRNLLRWVAFSLRPLSLNEVVQAISINAEGGLPFVDENLELLDSESFLDSCSSLVSTYHEVCGSAGSLEVYVKLAHFTVREFLISDTRKGHSWYSMETAVAHSVMARSCLAYFHQQLQSYTEGICRFPPLAAYAAKFWLSHHERSDEQWASDDLKSILRDMFNENEPYYKTWIRMAVVDRPWKREDYEDQAEYSPLYCAAFHGLKQVAITLLRQGASPRNGAGLYSNALQAASVRGHLQIVEALLNAGANVNEEGGFFGTSLAAASACGHLEIVRKLLEAGASVDLPAPWARATSGRRGDPLYRAVEFGYLRICELLLEKGANDYVHSKSQPPTALQLAVMQGRLDIVKALLRYERVHSVNINRLKADIQYHLGAQQRDAMWQELLAHDIIEYNADEPTGPGAMSLLKKDADVNDRDEKSEYLRTLELAVEQGEISPVEKLLSQKTDSDHEYAVSAALNAAIKAGSTAVVQLLLDTGLDLITDVSVSHQNRGKFLGSPRSMVNEDETMLTKAIRNRKEKIARLLLSRGAQAAPETPETIGTPLLYAIWEGLTGLVNDLLGQGADPNQRGTILQRNKPTFPLLLATETNKVEIIDRLLQAGARVNDQDQEGFSALHVAATSDGKIDALKFLLETPTIDKNVTLLNGSLPIHSAASRGTAESVGVLLAAGFDIHARNNTGRTPLHWAAVAGNWDTLEVLLDKGADASIRSVGHGAETPLDMAYLARRAPDWRKARDLEAHWDDERVDKLLQRLANRAAGK